MKGLLSFLRSHPVAWIAPIVIFLVVLLVLAWRMQQVPESPFAYREY